MTEADLQEYRRKRDSADIVAYITGGDVLVTVPLSMVDALLAEVERLRKMQAEPATEWTPVEEGLQPDAPEVYTPTVTLLPDYPTPPTWIAWKEDE